MEGKNLLHSWKEIASYLDCSVRTCHRWEEELDLPIHRLDGTTKARVFAYSDELEQWRAKKLGQAKSAEKTAESASRKKIRRILLLTGSTLALVAIAIIAWRVFPYERAHYSMATTVEEKKTSLTQAIENYRKFLGL